MGNTDLLKTLYLFKDLGESEIDIIKNTASLETFQTGDEVFSQGDRAKALYVIQSGAVKISQTPESGDTIEIPRLGPGSHFGEMSFLDGEARSATASAIEPTEIVEINYDKLSE